MAEMEVMHDSRYAEHHLAPYDTRTHSSTSQGTRTSHPQLPDTIRRPKGLKGLWMNTHTQVVMLGFVCFMCPGLFNALQGLGGGGQVNATTSANANSALYATFAFFAFFAGCVPAIFLKLASPPQLTDMNAALVCYRSINNVLGSKLTLLLGSCGYALYIGSYLCVHRLPPFPYLSRWRITAVNACWQHVLTLDVLFPLLSFP